MHAADDATLIQSEVTVRLGPASLRAIPAGFLSPYILSASLWIYTPLVRIYTDYNSTMVSMPYNSCGRLDSAT